MAWACRLGYTKILQGKYFLLVEFILLLHVIKNSDGFNFDCKFFGNCDCENWIDNEWDIQCPRGEMEDYPLILKLKQLEKNEVYVTIECDPKKPELDSKYLSGVNFKEIEEKLNFNVTEILVHYCPSTAIAGSHVIVKFLKDVNLVLEKIRRFVYVPPPKYFANFSFPSELFSAMPNLEYLDMQKLHLRSIPDLSFFKKLKELKLRENRISKVKVQNFDANENLQYLDLSLNEISELEENSFPSSLIQLNLNGNQIKNLSSRNFQHLKVIKDLTIGQNPLDGKIDEDTFANLNSLVNIYLENCNFTSFPKFANLQNMETLSISYNLANSNASYANSKSILIQNAPKLSKLILKNSGLQFFPVLENVSNLIYIQLADNIISELPKSFQNFSNLRILNMNGNRIKKLERIELPSLEKLYLSNNKIKVLNTDTFSKLENLEILEISNNQIQKIDKKAFKNLKSLIKLDLSHNKLSFQEFLREDENSEAKFIAYDPVSPFHFCTKLQTLDLSYNEIPEIFSDWRTLMIRLKTLNVSHNKISFIHATTLNFLSDNVLLNLDSNIISTISLEHADFILEDASSQNLKVLINENPLNCDCKLLAFKNFNLKGIKFIYDNLICAQPNWMLGQQFRTIKPRDLMCPVDNILGCPKACDCWDIPANLTIAVDCAYRNLNGSLPDFRSINSKWTQRYNYTLNLAGNNITELGPDSSKIITSRVAKVDLSENNLTSLSFLNYLQRNNVSSFYLAENRFSCSDCSFHSILRSHFRRISDYENVSCLFVTNSGYEENQKIEKYYTEEFPTLKFCQNYIVSTLTAEIQTMIALCSIFLIATIVLLVIYFRYGWAIRAFLYSKGYGCFFSTIEDSELEEGKSFDAFISYSHKDEDWVLTQLVKRLEEDEGFKLCLHFRDWIPGDWIPDQIVRSVDKSRRTVVILSKHFLESVWSRLEFKAAHSQALKDKTNRLILVMIDDELNSEELKDNDLRVYMKMNTYLKYSDPWFWHKLKYALPHRKTSSLEANILKHEQRERAIRLDKLREKMEHSIT